MSSALLKQHIKPLEKYFKTPGLIEIVINRPGEIWLETYEGWQARKDSELTRAKLWNFASALAINREQVFSEKVPILATALPEQGFRVFVVGGAMVVLAQQAAQHADGRLAVLGARVGAVALDEMPVAIGNVTATGVAHFVSFLAMSWG